MGAYPTQPSPYAGTSLLAQRLDPLTLFLYNQPPPTSPAPTTTTTLPPDPGYGAAAAAMPNQAQSYAANLGQAGAVAAPPDVPSRHEQFAQMRDLFRQLAPGRAVPDEALFPLLQQLWNQGTVYDWGGYGQGMGANIPFFDPQKRILGLFERYHDYLNEGNPPAMMPTGTDAPRILGVIPPGGAR